MSGLEGFRGIHEELEQLEIAAASFITRHDSRKDRILTDHALVFFKNSIRKRAEALVDFQADQDGLRTDQVSELSAEGETDIWHKFYVKIRGSKEYLSRHMEKHSASASSDAAFWYEQALDYAKQKEAEFSGEESRGRFVDLVQHHLQYMNLRRIREHHQKEFIQAQWLKHLRRHPESIAELETFRQAKKAEWVPIDYVSWLRNIHAFANIPRALKYRQADYRSYLSDLTSYLEKFIHKQQPLVNWENRISDFRASFDQRWSEGMVAGWETKTYESPLYAIVTDKLLTTEVAMNGHITSKEYRRAYERYERFSEEERAERVRLSIQHDYEVAYLEEFVRFLSEVLSDTISDTIEHVTRRQARTVHEVAMELAGIAGEKFDEANYPDDISDQSSSGGEEIGADDRATYNPKNLPMGPDGKPIPYWQYKLFGLDKEFGCEICGNFTYFGRRTFDKHFSEWRHINGLRALRIHNSNHFFGITGIEEAIAINDKIRQQTSSAVFNVDKEMECEDAMGNVMSYRAYQDLVRQGMI